MAVRAEDRVVGVRHAAEDRPEELADLVRRRVADRVGQVDRRAAGVDDRLDDAAQEVADRCASRPRPKTPRRRCTGARGCTAATAASRHASRVMRSLRSRCRSEVAMKVWMRRRGGRLRAPRRRARCRPGWQRASAGDRPAACTSRRDRAAPPRRRPREAIGKPGLDDVHAERVELPRQLSASRATSHREARAPARRRAASCRRS